MSTLSNKGIAIPSFDKNYTASRTASLEWDQTRTPQQVKVLEKEQSYIDFTTKMLEELRNNSDIGKQYTIDLHKRRAQNEAYKSEYEQQSDGTLKYIGKKQGIFREDGSIDPDQWYKARNDGKWGLVHLSDFNEQPTPTTLTIPRKREDPIQPRPDTESNPFTFNIDPVQPTKSKWTDWLPIMSKYFTNRAAVIKDANLQKQLSFPKIMPKERHAIKTDAYLQRQLLEKQKQEVLARADAIPTSNMEDRLRIMNQAQEIAEKYSDRQAQLQSAEYQTTAENVTKALNYNNSERVDAANHNMKVASAAKNNLINALRSKAAKLATNFNSTVDSLYHDYGKWLHDQRLDERRKTELELGAQTEAQLSDMSQRLADMQAPENWKQLTSFATALTHPNAALTQEEADIINKWVNNTAQGLRTDPAFRNLIISKLQTSQDPISTRWREAWSEYKNRIQRQHDASSRRAIAQHQQNIAGLPTIIDNQIWTYTPTDRRSSLMKEGGRLKQLKELARRNQRAKEQHDKNFNDAQKRESDQLRDQLDALNKEQLLLLKAIFK